MMLEFKNIFGAKLQIKISKYFKELLFFTIKEDDSKSICLNENDSKSISLNKDECADIIHALSMFIATGNLPETEQDPLDRYLDKFRKREGENSDLTLLLVGICEEIKQLRKK